MSPKGKLFHYHLGQKRLRVAEGHSSLDAYGPVFHADILYQELAMLLPYLFSYQNGKMKSDMKKTNALFSHKI